MPAVAGTTDVSRPAVFKPDQTAVWMDFAEGTEMPAGHGAAGAYVGTSGGALIVAGGLVLPVTLPECGAPLFTDRIMALRTEQGLARWESLGTLPEPAAYGASVTWTDTLICLGGENADGPLDRVLRLRWDSAAAKVITDTALPKLPRPLSFVTAAYLNDRIYLAGGKGADGQASADFFTLDLKSPAAGWQKLPPWPGPPRYGALMAAQYIENTGFIYLFGGKSDEHHLTENFRYDPATLRWRKCAPLPRTAFLAPILAVGQSRIMVFGGADGVRSEPDDNHAYPAEVRAYHTVTDTWAQHGTMPTGVAGTSAVLWEGNIVIPGGAQSPGVATVAVQTARLRTAASRFGLLDQLALYTYLAALAGLCLWLYFRHRKEKTTEDFFLGGRDLPGWAAGLSLMATAVSSIGFMAIPAKTFAADWTYFAGTLTWFVVVPIVVVAFIPFFRRVNVATAYELLETRFDLKVRTFAAVGFSLMEGGRMAIVLLLPATALATVTTLSVEQTVVLMGIGSMLYAVMAGMRGVVWTDVVQGVVMIGGALLCVVIAVLRVGGGFGELLSTAAADNKFAFNFNWSPAAAGVWVVVVGNIFIRLAGFTSSQSSVQRLLATPDERQASKALWTDVWVSVPWAIIVFFLGTALYVFYKRFPAALPPGVRDIEILPIFMSQQLPPGCSGIVIAAIFAAGMSSLDTSMHSLATTWTRDFYGRFIPGTSDRSQLIFSKIMIFLFGFLATGSALLIHHAGIRGMWDFFISLFGLFGGVLCGIFMLARFSRRANARGTLLGGAVSFLLMILAWRYNLVHGLLYTALGTLLCASTGWLFSLVLPTQPPTDTVQRC
jgi:SSS family transporter